jgi:uncharacterized protein YukE
MVRRLEDAEKAKMQSTTEAARLKGENEDLRRQLDQLQNIKVDTGDVKNLTGGDSRQKYLGVYDKFEEQLANIKEKLNSDAGNLVPIGNTSFSRQQIQSSAHSRRGSEIGNNSFHFP